MWNEPLRSSWSTVRPHVGIQQGTREGSLFARCHFLFKGSPKANALFFRISSWSGPRRGGVIILGLALHHIYSRLQVWSHSFLSWIHASFRDFLVDRHRSEHLQIDEHAAHSLLLKSCMRHLPDASIYRSMCSIVEEYSRDCWWKHYSHGNSIKEGSLDSILQAFKPNMGCLSFSASTPHTRLIYWWSIYGRVRSYCHRQVSKFFYLDGNSFNVCPFLVHIPKLHPSLLQI